MSDLASYASNFRRSRGRLFGASASPTRSEYQRDRDRIIHSTAFRRLQHKTQVFLHHEGQHFRTRLTHTLEVSQMARSIARALRLDEDLAEAVALAHDLGHTPFGHAGERALSDRMASTGGFDHNIQALRVVTVLENRYAEHDGLNLTWETLEGILKHNGPLEPLGGMPSGMAGLPLPGDLRLGSFASLEAQAAAIADDIAYHAHDIDDALRANLLRLADLAEVPLVGPIVGEVLETYPGISAKRQAHEVQRRLITRSIVDVIETSGAEIAKAGVAGADDVREAGRRLIRMSPAMEADEAALKTFLFAHVYRHPSVIEPARRGEDVVRALFDAYSGAHRMPGRWDALLGTQPDAPGRARVVADFIAGMTDPYAIEEHARLFDASEEFR